MKCNLRNLENGKFFSLNPFRTKIGKDGCDLNFKSFAVENEHAAIQYDCHLQCYFIEDLNTSYGTYVNDCRVQNAAVRLAHGDIIRLGHGGPRLEVCYELSPNTWDDTLNCSTSLNQTPRTVSFSHSNSYYGYSNGATNSSHYTPKPPSHTRPQTAHPSSLNFQSSPRSYSTHIFSKDDCLNNDKIAVSEMNDQLDSLNNDLHDQLSYKIDNMQNENMVDALRNEVTAIRREKLGIKYKGDRFKLLHNDHLQRMASLQAQIAQRDYRNKILHKEVEKLKSIHCEKSTLQFEEMKNRLSCHEDRIAELENDLNCSIQEKRQLNDVLNSLKKEIAAKDLMLQKVKTKADKHLNEVKNKDQEIKSLSLKVHHHGKLKEIDNEIKKKDEEISMLKHKVSLLNQTLKDKDFSIKSYQQSLLEANDNVRQLENFNSDGIIQKVGKLAIADGKTFYSFSNVDDICNFISDIQHDRDKYKAQLKNISQEKLNMEKYFANPEQVEILKGSLSHIERRLVENGRLCKNLMKEHDRLKDIDVPDQLKWIKDLFMSLLSQEYVWEQDIENSLQNVNNESLNVDPSLYVKNLKLKMVDQKNKIIELEERLNDTEASTSDLYIDIKKKLKEKYKKNTEKALKDLKESEERKFETERRRLKQQEAEHISEALAAQRDSYDRRNEDMALVSKKINQLKEKHRLAREEFVNLQNELLKSKRNEDALLQSLKDSESSMSKLKAATKEKYFHKFEAQLVKLKSEIKDYTSTIQQLEDKIAVLNKEKNNLEFEVMKYSRKEKKYKQDGRNSAIYQQEIQELTNQNKELMQKLLNSEKECKEQKELAKTLTKDLNGVSSRLLDIKGEFSKEQRNTIEDLQNEISKQSRQLDEQSKQLLELSAVAELQKKKLIEQDTQIVKQNNMLALQAGHLREKNKPPVSSVMEGLSSQKIHIAERCLADNHDQVIEQQKHAIADLRKSLKSQEYLQPRSEPESLISKIRLTSSKKAQPQQHITAHINTHIDANVY